MRICLLLSYLVVVSPAFKIIPISSGPGTLHTDYPDIYRTNALDGVRTIIDRFRTGIAKASTKASGGQGAGNGALLQSDTDAPSGDRTIDDGQRTIDGAQGTLAPNGSRTIDDGQRTIDGAHGTLAPGGDRTIDDGQRTIDDAQGTLAPGGDRTIDDGQRTIDGSQGTLALNSGRTIDDSQRTIDGAQVTLAPGGDRTIDDGQRTIDASQRTIDGAHGTEALLLDRTIDARLAVDDVNEELSAGFVDYSDAINLPDTLYSRLLARGGLEEQRIGRFNRLQSVPRRNIGGYQLAQDKCGVKAPEGMEMLCEACSHIWTVWDLHDCENDCEVYKKCFKTLIQNASSMDEK
ncbi:unnamed protein product [Bursaphelenchus okinawaensis]|uniref:Uncharacterized protein n=1 Tax=Bursaphelenchus okinawaensis TaxID=465554 RepID=A0A811K1G5_9BILA|nr:unnamed protein product [Bursaphelenchus okinawaensis]CAG9089752.1 unnamed protein product [Bursaphelenchus okinawaensis]